MKIFKENFVSLAFLGCVVGLLAFPIWSHNSEMNRIDSLSNQINDLSLGSPVGEPLGGITRVAIGTQTKWTTDLTPSASFTVNLGSSALPVNQMFFTKASGSYGEFTQYASATAGFFKNVTVTGTCTGCSAFDPTTIDAATWSDGANASNLWTFDLSGTDPTLLFRSAGFTFTGGVSVSANFEALGFASASSFFGSAFASVGDCNDSGEAIGWTTTGLFNCNASLQPLDATLTALAAFNTNGLMTQTAADTFTGRTITGTTNQITVTNGDGVSGNPVLSLPSYVLFPGSASTSTNFEVLGYASISGKLTQNSVASNSFLGSLTGATTGTLSVGTSNNPLKILWSNIIKSVVQFFFPTTTSTVPSSSGEAIVNTSSESLDVYTGTSNRILDGIDCFTYVVDSPTTSNPSQVGPKRFNNPFTITSVQPVASGSNAAGWNLVYGSPGSLTTSVFTNNKSASTSAYPTYTSFANSTLTDGQALAVQITSRSAVLQTFSVTVCGRQTH